MGVILFLLRGYCRVKKINTSFCRIKNIENVKLLQNIFGLPIFVSQYKNIFVKRNPKPIMKYRLLLLVAVLFSWIGGNYAAVVPESTAVETANMLLSQRGGVLF